MDKVLVAGAGFAGIQAAFSLADKGYNVTVLDKSSEHIYIPGLIELVRKRCETADLTVDLEKLFDDTSIDFEQEEIKDLDPERDAVIAEEEYNYDYLVLALGGEPVVPEGFQDVKIPYSLDEASELGEIEGEVAVIGSGYTGVELAFEFAEKGLSVEVFDMETRPLPRFSENVSEKILESMHREDINFRGGKQIESVQDGKIIHSQGEEVFDNVILNIGIKRSSLIEDCFEDFEVNSGLNSVDHDNIFAVGDCNDVNPNTAHSAIYEGRKVAENISKKDYQNLDPAKPREIGYLVSTGKRGIYLMKGRSFESRLLRYGKDIIRKGYFFRLGFQAWKKRNLM